MPWGTIVTFVADKKGIVANIWGIRGVEEGGKPNAGAWTEVRWLKRSGWQIYGVRGFSKVDGWQRRAGKSTKDRWQARGQHTSVKSIRIGKKKNPD